MEIGNATKRKRTESIHSKESKKKQIIDTICITSVNEDALPKIFVITEDEVTKLMFSDLADFLIRYPNLPICGSSLKYVASETATELGENVEKDEVTWNQLSNLTQVIDKDYQGEGLSYIPELSNHIKGIEKTPLVLNGSVLMHFTSTFI